MYNSHSVLLNIIVTDFENGILWLVTYIIYTIYNIRTSVLESFTARVHVGAAGSRRRACDIARHSAGAVSTKVRYILLLQHVCEL